MGFLVWTVLVLGQAGPTPKTGEWSGLLQKEALHWGVPGAAMVVVRKGQVEVVCTGKLSLDGGEAVKPETAFPAGSCTKAFTTTLLALQVARGLCSWEDEAHRHLDWFPREFPDQVGTPVKLWHLGSHTSGMLAHDLLFYRRDEPGRTLVEALLKQKPSWQPGTHYQYQNLMVRTLGLVSQSLENQPWEVLLTKQVLSPLDIQGASYDREGWLNQPSRPRPHKRDGQGKVVSFADAWFPQNPDPCSSLALPLKSWGSWLKVHLEGAGGLSPDQTREILATHNRRILQPRDIQDPELFPEIDQMGYGLGWVTMSYRGETALAHGGVMDGYRTFLLLLPRQKVGVAVFANLDRTPMCHSVACQTIDRILDLKEVDWNDKWKRKEEREEKAKSELASRIEQAAREWENKNWPNEYLGTYQNEGYGPLQIESTPAGGTRLIVLGRKVSLIRVDRNLGFALDPLLGQASVRFFSTPRGRWVEIGGRVESSFLKRE